MNSINFLYLYFICVGSLWLILAAFVLYQTNEGVLVKKGFDEEYKAFLKKDHRKRAVNIALYIPVLLLFSGFIVRLIFGELSSFLHLLIIGIIWFVGLIPFPIIDMKKTNLRYKELALKTKSEVFIDIDYRILRLVFNPVLEIVGALLFITYFGIFFHIFHYGSVHLVFPWLFYSSARSGKHLTPQLLKWNYMYAFVFMMINHFLVIFHLFWKVTKMSEELYLTGYLFGSIVAVFLLGKFIYYLLHLPKFREVLKSLVSDIKTV